MNLYVWEGVLTDWTSGMIVALAKDLPAAYRAIGRLGSAWYEREARQYEPEITKLPGTSSHMRPRAWAVAGGS